MKRVN